ncbi:MAG: bifunctional folylpolyglutamate synthase/dihydrofolate synthase [Bacillota bacterium]
MNFNEAVEYVESLEKFGIKLGLDTIKNLLDFLGNPQESYKVIHVAGTNGKGSTSNFIYQTLVESDIDVGLFSTPHLSYYNEKIRYNNKMISNDDFVDVVKFVKSNVEKMVKKGYNQPTRFEVLTGICLEFFKRKKLEYVVLEVGMGGRLDSTNIVNPEISVITPIAMDHKDYLGDTIEKVAFEKAGIIKKNTKVITSNTNPKVLKVLEEKSENMDSKLIKVDSEKYKIKSINLNGIKFRYKNEIYKISMIAKYQIQNAILALEVLKNLDENLNIKKGLKEAKWPGRFEIINDKPLIIIDGAHNLQGANALKISIKKLFKDKKILGIFGMLKDKDVENVLKETMELFEKVIVTEVNNPRAIKLDELYKRVRNYSPNVEKEKLNKLINKVKEESQNYDATIIFGSLYMIGDFRKMLVKSKK